MSFLDLCEKYFESRDFYDILKINKNATDKDVKKAYHKLSLLVHPDRVDNEDKIIATEKFKVLGKIHSVLSDKEKRKVYDETGQFDEDSDEVAMKDWTAYWRLLFKKITVEDISSYEKKYKGSEEEVNDLKKAYIQSKGSMDFILESVPFTNCDDEPRLHDIINTLIKTDVVPEYKKFTHEPKAKKLRRKRKWEKEAEERRRLDEAEKLEREDGFIENDENNLVLMIREKQEQRREKVDNFFDQLAAKYCGKDKKVTKKNTPRKRSESLKSKKSPKIDPPSAKKRKTTN